MAQRYNPLQGKWTVNRLLKRAIEANGGEMPVEDLLEHMSNLGYMKEPLRDRLRFLDVDVVDGVARLRGWQGG